MIRGSPSLTARPEPIDSAPATIVRSLRTSNALAVLADAALAVDRVALGLEADRDDREREDRAGQRERGRGDEDVERAPSPGALGGVPAGLGAVAEPVVEAGGDRRLGEHVVARDEERAALDAAAERGRGEQRERRQAARAPREREEVQERPGVAQEPVAGDQQRVRAAGSRAGRRGRPGRRSARRGSSSAACAATRPRCSGPSSRSPGRSAGRPRASRS